MQDRAVIIIPALNPPKSLVNYCRSLLQAGFSQIILIDDGSCEVYKELFSEIADLEGCSVLRHAINLGKGRALKDAFNQFLNMTDYQKYSGVITVDSDGQHAIKDVLAINEEMAKNKPELILGVRDFHGKDIPSKSRFGNRLTCKVFQLLHGIKLKDTQTGLRGIPTKLLKEYLLLQGERFEYETNMLIATAMKQIPFYEVDIQTIYVDGNKETHFHPIRDSLAIYRLLFFTFIKYTVASFSSFVLDIALFQFILMLAGNMGEAFRIGIATVMSRLISSIFNFFVNKNIVFRKKGKNISLIVKYYCLCILQMVCSAGLVLLFYQRLGISETIVKILVDTVLFMISYRVQKSLIFVNGEL